jgi:hypothetical protein
MCIGISRPGIKIVKKGEGFQAFETDDIKESPVFWYDYPVANGLVQSRAKWRQYAKDHGYKLREKVKE